MFAFILCIHDRSPIVSTTCLIWVLIWVQTIEREDKYEYHSNIKFLYILQNLRKMIFDRFLAPSLKLDADASFSIRKFLSNFLKVLNSLIAAKVTVKPFNRYSTYGLVILMKYSVLGP